MTNGNVLKSIIKFAIPCIITRLIQNLYPLIDAVIAGSLLNEESLSAIGIGGSVYSLFNDTVLGLVAGFAVVAGKRFGAKQEDAVKSVYAHSLLFTLLVGVSVSAAGIIFSKQILALLQTPTDIAEISAQYLFVMFLGFLPNALFNFYCEIMRALGDSKRPLYLLILSSVLHLVLIIPLTKLCGISGAALATVLSYLITVIVAALMVRRSFPNLRLSPFTFQKNVLKECLSIGVPMALTSAVVMVGVLLLNLVTNTIGTDYIAAYTCASKIGYIITTPIFGFATALAVFVSQNFGAKQFDRIREGVNKTFKVTFAVDAVLLIVALIICKPILRLILGGNDVAVDAGFLYLTVRCVAMFVLTPAAFYKNLLPAIGRPFFSTFSGFVEIGIRYAFPMLFSTLLGFVSVPLTDAVVWSVLAAILLPAYYFELKKVKDVIV